MIAASRENVLQGVVMSLRYSLGLGIFFISAILIDKLKSAFAFQEKTMH